VGLERRIVIRLVILAITLASCGDGGSDSPADALEFQANAYTRDNQREPGIIALAGGDIVIAWNSDGQDGDGFGVFVRRFSPELVPVADETQVNVATVGNETLETLAPTADGGFIVAWSDNTVGLARRYDADGVAGDPYEIEGGFGFAAAIDGDGRFVVTTSDGCSRSTSYGDQSYGCIHASRTEADGTLDDAPFQVGTASYDYQGYLIDQERPLVAANRAGEFVVVWSEASFYYGHHGDYEHFLYGRGFDADQSPVGAQFRAGGSGYLHQPGAADLGEAGEFVVVSRYCSSPYEIYGRSCYYAGIGGSRGAVGETSTPFNVVSQEGYDAREYVDIDPSAALNAVGEFVVVWERSPYDDANTSVMAKVFDAAGTESGNAYPVHPESTSSQCCPRSLRLDDGAVIVVWETADDGDGTGIFVRRLAGDGLGP
jgi:hypothetical protein